MLNFRNHAELNLSFKSRFIIITGSNGTGKTNLLDAIHYLSMGKSYFHRSDEPAVKDGDTAFLISGKIIDNNSEVEIKTSFVSSTSEGKSKKSVFKNERALKSLSELIDFFPVVMVCPQDMEIITGASDTRRRFVNEILSQTDRDYLIALTNFKKTLTNRNQYLKALTPDQPVDIHLIQVFNEQLCEQAAVILKKRDEWLKDFISQFKLSYECFSPLHELPAIRWKFSTPFNEMKEKLEAHLQRDRILGYTAIGPHKDDLLFFLDGKPLKNTASQGQQKSFLLALKMARYKYIHSKTGKEPPLLLDDIYDKLDESRFKSFMGWLKEQGNTQVFITDTHEERMRNLCAELNIEADFINTNNEITASSGLPIS